MAKQKGTKTVTVDIGVLTVTVECDEEGGYEGTLVDLAGDVAQLVREDIEQLETEGAGWNVSDVAIKVMS